MNNQLPLSAGIVERIGLVEGTKTHNVFSGEAKKKIKETFPIPNHSVGLKRVAELLTALPGAPSYS
jgi:acetate kinase